MERRYVTSYYHSCSAKPPFHHAYAFQMLSHWRKCLPLGPGKWVVLQWYDSNDQCPERARPWGVDRSKKWTFGGKNRYFCGTKALTGWDRESAHPLQLHVMKGSCCTAANPGATGRFSPSPCYLSLLALPYLLSNPHSNHIHSFRSYAPPPSPSLCSPLAPHSVPFHNSPLHEVSSRFPSHSFCLPLHFLFLKHCTFPPTVQFMSLGPEQPVQVHVYQHPVYKVIHTWISRIKLFSGRLNTSFCITLTIF